MPISEIHLIHHTHADFGYTDLPSTALGFLKDYLRDALRIAARTAELPEEARLHYTCEITWLVEEFLRTATAAERRQWDALVRSGQFEIGAMPFHISPLLGTEEWSELMRQAAPLRARYSLRTCFQNDVNGLPWGLIPSFKEQGVEFVMMGINTYSGAVPQPAPAAFWWEGPDGHRVLAWLGYHYCAAYNFFYEGEWRRGPVPSHADVWFNPPSGREIFDDSPAALKSAHAHLQAKLAADLSHYPHRTLAVQFTNMWRVDNDPPCEQLCHFVKAWNEAGLQPRLRLSTPATFLSQLRDEAGSQLPVVRGDWADWWADGVASMPTETALAQRAKAQLADIPSAKAILKSSAAVEAQLASAWRHAALYTEHTFASWDSLANPYQPLTLGCLAQKAGCAYRADEEARLARAAVIRASPDYRPFSQTRRFTVLNPGAQSRSGWVDISAPALRSPASAVRDVATGEIIPLETVLAPNWSAPDPAAPRPFEIPDDIFSFQPMTLRFYCANLAAGESRRFELLQADLPPAASAADAGGHGDLSWRWNSKRGLFDSLRHEPTGSEVIDAAAPFGLGQPVFELPQGFGAREKLLQRKPCEVRRETPALVEAAAQPSHHGACYRVVWRHENCHRIEQRWDLPPGTSRLELTSTFWLREVLAPQAIYLAFPFELPGAEAVYHSLGCRTRVGEDQMPNTCGEYQCVNDGVEFVGSDCSVALATRDTPLGCFESLAARTGRVAFTPRNAHFYSVVSKNYWVTNFSHTKAAKLVVRHLVQAAPGSCSNLARLNSGLWAYPSA
ncbi:MAG: hypothetical protein MUE94_05090 [Verrucomicrobia bacterium]|jgi:hypothetical protein|nr:hypothetical protein [Verrucomicrobiota bacterium]